MKDKDTELLKEAYAKIQEDAYPGDMYVVFFTAPGSSDVEGWTTLGNTEKGAWDNLVKHFNQIGKSISDFKNFQIKKISNASVKPFTKIR